MGVIMLFVLCLITAIIGMAMADSRGRSAMGGFFLGLFLTVIGLAIIALMGKAPSEESHSNYNNEIYRKIKEKDN